METAEVIMISKPGKNLSGILSANLITDEHVEAI
jgi:hypothetical protein